MINSTSPGLQKLVSTHTGHVTLAKSPLLLSLVSLIYEIGLWPSLQKMPFVRLVWGIFIGVEVKAEATWK